MIEVKKFTFNAFQENAYVVHNEDNEAIIFDPGCNNQSEKEVLAAYIETNNLKPIKLVNTHCHIDHVLGNKFAAQQYGLSLEASKLEVSVLSSCSMVSQMYGIPYELSPEISDYLGEGNDLVLGAERFQILLCPGHSPGSLCFYHTQSEILIGGDVLFQNSIGRTDLPGGNHATLISSIKTKLFKLPDDTVVLPGHGPSTTIGVEKRSNPFLT